MNKTEVTDRLAARTGLSKGAGRDAVDGVFAIVGENLADGEEVRLPGFGTFRTRSRPAHTGRNPRTGEAVAMRCSRGAPPRCHSASCRPSASAVKLSPPSTTRATRTASSRP